MENYLDNKEVMSKLKIKSLTTLRKKIDEGLKVSSGEKKNRRFKESDVKNFLDGVIDEKIQG